ncbi:uncharacterized protein [Triticum aestivum]|uniref:uncharacterized protein n=1 Tax=Triticum aestivum TaxID=4565 RepID=UPI001D01A6DB|nr:uncharacterized protein LOC123041255 [Triticum aestivum]
MLDTVTKMHQQKENKANELNKSREEVNLSHSEGEETSDDDQAKGKQKRVRHTSSSKGSGGPIEKFCKSKPEEVVASKGTKVKVQSALTLKRRKERRNHACEYICQFFYEAGFPYSAVTLSSFVLMLEAIGDFGRDLKGPTPYEMSGPFLKKRKKKVLEKLKAHREPWKLSGCSVMTDAWTDRKGRGVMNLVVHSAYGVCFLDSVDYSAVKKDGKYIFDLVDRCIEDACEKNIVQVVTDNARANEAAASLLKAKRPNIFWTGCAAHCIDLLLEDIGLLPPVEVTITKARSLTVFLYAHTRFLELMIRFLGRIWFGLVLLALQQLI